jgi:ABC-type amino acid transport substrate-binding protein
MLKHLGKLALSGAALLSPTVASAAMGEIEARGVLRVLAVPESAGGSVVFAPSEAPGFDYEVLQGFVRLKRLRLELVPVDSWDRLVPALIEGRGDVIAGSFTVTPERQKSIDFTAEVLPTRSIVVTRKPHRIVRTVEELRSERITAFKGTSMAALLVGLGVPASNLDYDVPAEGLTAGLKAGRVACVVHDVQTAIVDQRMDPELQLGMFLGPPGSYSFGVRKADAQLLAALNEHIANVKRSGTWSRLTVKYFGEMALEVLQKARAE